MCIDLSGKVCMLGTRMPYIVPINLKINFCSLASIKLLLKMYGPGYHIISEGSYLMNFGMGSWVWFLLDIQAWLVGMPLLWQCVFVTYMYITYVHWCVVSWARQRAPSLHRCNLSRHRRISNLPERGHWATQGWWNSQQHLILPCVSRIDGGSHWNACGSSLECPSSVSVASGL